MAGKEHPCSFPMNGGDGPNSYTLNSSFQRSAADSTRAKIVEVIMERLDHTEFPPTAAKVFAIADLGCSVGPNTFFAVEEFVRSVQETYLSQGISSSGLPQFQAFFNDQVNNDFNTLFVSLPPDRSYFAAGVPGSFHGRLFPDSSLHFVHSSYALHWLSKLPEELLDPNSPAFNKGRVHYTGGPDEVRKAYETQFAIDMAAFLRARSKEILGGGFLAVIMPGIPAGVPHSSVPAGLMYEILDNCLLDMVNEGIIGEAELDSFNLPVYSPTPEEMAQLIKEDGGFDIEILELTKPEPKLSGPIPSQALTMHMRAGMEGVISRHFGKDIIDRLFDLYFCKTEEQTDRIRSLTLPSSQLLMVLKCKQH
ncbi:hypothetical protein MLD38_004439 [Melastoma candidum]|uniref:Uncharacterized protein n=1 Tax=Melastoma candidum TaxID=119954 RepID=A0ACB9S8Z2_9MYRT|nr:hypothetical protein MLD38_004439 [Melastoma candidum]